MATLVRQKKFKKVKKNTFKKKRNKTRLIYPTVDISIKWLRIFILLVIFWYGLFFIINNTIFKDENYIEQITYSKTSVDTYDNPYLYKKISELIKYENYYVVSKLRKSDIENTIKSEFPLVKKIKIIQPEKYTASVKIEFYTPEIIIRLWERKFGVIWNYNFEIFSGNNIDKNIFFVELPQYTTWINSLAWLFYEIPVDKFICDMDVIAQWFPWYKRLVYLPWSSRTVVFVSDDKRVYLNNKNPLTWQIENYNLLQKYYDQSDGLKIIDLGSLENDKIIVRQ
jgi:hypothetical protein